VAFLLGQVRKYCLRQGLTHWRSLRPEAEAEAEAQCCCGICSTGKFMSSSLAMVLARCEQTVSAAAAARVEEALALWRAVTSSSKLVTSESYLGGSRKGMTSVWTSRRKPPVGCSRRCSSSRVPHLSTHISSIAPARKHVGLAFTFTRLTPRRESRKAGREMQHSI